MKTFFFALPAAALLLLNACGNQAAGNPSAAQPPSAQQAAASGAAGQTFAAGKGSISEDRTAAFKSFMPTFSTMRKMANGDEAFDAAKFKEYAARFQQEARVPFEHFQNDPNGNGDALPAVWLQPEAFAAERDKFLAAVDALNTAAQSGNLEQIKVATGNAGASCKACHDTFRAPK